MTDQTIAAVTGPADYAQALAAARRQGWQDAIDALRDTLASQGSWLWHDLGESALQKVIDWLDAAADILSTPLSATHTPPHTPEAPADTPVAQGDAEALDGACASVWLHGKWRYLTSRMTTEQREAFADAADRHWAAGEAESGDELARVDRWWRDDAPIAAAVREAESTWTGGDAPNPAQDAPNPAPAEEDAEPDDLTIIGVDHADRIEGYHIGRAWSGTAIEDQCPCIQALCGLVVQGQADPACTQHPIARAKTIRQSHRAADCPGIKTGIPSHASSVFETFRAAADAGLTPIGSTPRAGERTVEQLKEEIAEIGRALDREHAYANRHMYRRIEVEQERDEARAEVKQLRAQVERLQAEVPHLVSAGPNSNGEYVVEIKTGHELVKAIAVEMMDLLDAEGGPNYVQWDLKPAGQIDPYPPARFRTGLDWARRTPEVRP